MTAADKQLNLMPQSDKISQHKDIEFFSELTKFEDHMDINRSRFCNKTSQVYAMVGILQSAHQIGMS